VTPKITDDISLYGRKINNRVVFQPMEGCDGSAGGGIGELTRRRYLRFAGSGAGILWFEAIAVTPEGRANPRQLFINPGNVNEYKALIVEIKAVAVEAAGEAPVVIAQLNHSGRFSKPNGAPEPLVAYRNPLWEKGRESQPYKVVSDGYLGDLPEKFRLAAALAREAGFDGVDIKCCHGYLFDELLSAYDRPGVHGGSLKNRMRCWFDCIAEVKKEIGPELFVTARLNASDAFPYPYGFGTDASNGIDLCETKEIISELDKKFGMEMINITLGNPYLIPHVNRPWTGGPEDAAAGMARFWAVTGELQRAFPKIALVMSALTYPGERAIEYSEKALAEGVAKLCGFGRMTFAYPGFYRDYLDSGKLDKRKVCIKCGKCTELMRAGTVTGCPIRDTEVYLPYYKKYVLKKED
jgi:NADH:flavin oxidoreductases, Old Yellow Enzyme family